VDRTLDEIEAPANYDALSRDERQMVDDTADAIARQKAEDEAFTARQAEMAEQAGAGTLPPAVPTRPLRSGPVTPEADPDIGIQDVPMGETVNGAEVVAPVEPKTPQMEDFDRQELAKVQEKVQREGVTLENAEAIASVMANWMRDPVTTLPEGRTGGARVAYIKHVHNFVKQFPEVDASYVVADLSNLGGMNKFFGEAGANEVFRHFAGIMKKHLGPVAQNVRVWRHGGDELSAAVSGVSDPVELENAIAAAQAEARAYNPKLKRVDGKMQLLQDIPHGKEKELVRAGTGLYFASGAIRPESVPETVLKDVSDELERQKEARKAVLLEEARGKNQPAGGANQGRKGRKGRPLRKGSRGKGGDADNAGVGAGDAESTKGPVPPAEPVRPLEAEEDADPDDAEDVADLGEEADDLEVITPDDEVPTGNEGIDAGEMEILNILAEAPSPSKGYAEAMRFIKSTDASTEEKEGLVKFLKGEVRGDVDFAMPEEQIPEGPAGDFIRKLFDLYPSLRKGLSIVEGKTEGASGAYDAANRIATLMSSTDPVTALHEIFHHAERMLDKPTRDSLISEWEKAFGTTVDAARERGNTKRAAALEFLKAAVEDRSIREKWVRDEIAQYFKNGVLRQGDYALASASEFFAANAARIMSGRLGDKGLAAKVKDFFRSIVEAAKSTLGLRSDAPVLRALRRLASGNGKFLSQEMLRESAKRIEEGRVEYSLPEQDQTQTPAFKKWFGKSKVVDAEGKPLVVYHGTKAAFNIFDTQGSYRSRQLGAMFTADKGYAENYGRSERGGRVISAYLRMENPLDANNESHFAEYKENRKPAEDFSAYAKRSGHDGAITSFDKSNLGSFSEINLLINLESAIGICSINIAILFLSSSPSIATMCFNSFVVTTGAVLSDG
jgi:GGDEF domain-containing protein